MTKQQLLNKKNIFLALSAIAVFVLYGAYEFGFLQSKATEEEINYNANPNGTVAVIDSDIIISTPASNDIVESPLKISGRAKAGEVFTFLLKNGLNQVVASTTLELDSETAGWLPYSQTITFDNPLTPGGILEIIPADGSSEISIPVRFAAFQNLPVVNVFFSNIKEDPEVLNCDVVYPIPRRLFSEEVSVPAVLQTLFLGLSDEEIAQGYVNNLPEGDVKLLSFNIEDGAVHVDFSQELQEGVAGSCRVMAIRAQITETLKQFDNIDEVVISVEGNVEEALQP